MPDGRGLFLDLDGTLADSHAMLRDVHAAICTQAGLDPATRPFESVIALTVPEIVAGMCRDAPGADAEALLAAYGRLVYEGYRDVPPRPDAAALLAWARDEGIATCVVTSAQERPSRAWLDAHGLLDPLADVIGIESVAATKPDPAPYRMALERLACDPAQSAAVEDSPGGATSAHAAGLATYALAPEGAPGAWPPLAGFLTQLSDVREHFA